MNDTVLQIENTNSRLITTDKVLKDFLSEKLRFRPKNYWHSQAYKRKIWDGWKYFFNSKSGVFLTGILPEVKLVLKKLNKEYAIIDNREQINWAYRDIDQNFLKPWWPAGTQSFELHDYQPDLVNQCIKHNRGIVQAPTGCHRKGQKILMFDGSLKKVEDIKVGDELMGMHSTSRKVQSLIRNQGQMYKIIPDKGDPFVVNEDHILTLVEDNYNKSSNETLVDVSVKEWLDWSNGKKQTHKLFRVGVNFEQKIEQRKPLKIDPYIMGVILSCDDFLETEYSTKEYLESSKKNSESVFKNLETLGLFGKKPNEKFIPQVYKTSSRESRLNLIAALLDSNCNLRKDCYEINFESKQLAEDVIYISRSVGLASYMKSYKNRNGEVNFQVSISGETCMIPCRVIPNNEIAKDKNALKTSFKVEKLGLENYYGFELDGDRRYLLSDFTVTHNSGKTFILVSLLKCLPPKTPTLFLTKNAQLVHQNWEEMNLWGVENLGRWYDKYKEPNYVMCVTNHVNTFQSIEKLLPKFKVLIVDEVHDCMSDVPVAAYKKMKNASVRIGISATAFKWNKKKIDDVHKWNLKGYFGPIFKTTTTESGSLTTKELQERGILSKSDCVFYPVTSPDLKYEPYQDAVKMGIEQNFHFHDMVKKLVESCPGRTLIVVERIEQGQYLNQLIPNSNFIQGKNKLKEREPIMNSLRKGEKSVAIVMRQIITAGINVKIHDLINAAGGEGCHNVIQLMGRGLRTAEDKEKLRYHDFHFLNNDYLKKHSEWRMEVLKKEGHSVTVKNSFDL